MTPAASLQRVLKKALRIYVRPFHFPLIPVVTLGGIKGRIAIRHKHFDCDEASAQSVVGVRESQIGSLAEVTLSVRIGGAQQPQGEVGAQRTSQYRSKWLWVAQPHRPQSNRKIFRQKEFRLGAFDVDLIGAFCRARRNRLAIKAIVIKFDVHLCVGSKKCVNKN